MLNRKSVSLLWLGLVALLGAASPAARAQNATISGEVTDASGAVVANAQSSLTNQATQERLETGSNKAGVYTLAGVAPGTYDLTVSAPGYKTEKRTNIVVEVAANISLDVKMSVGATDEQVVVNGAGENINTVDASVSTVIDRQFVENIPLN